ncbi:alpha/beta hydrolase family protein [Microlunatus sp. GCM10028923]|uniref:alpha/beta hydrolase family protein n=1 Tax=Microlunatus sp. GCM10028923 TaxID=3273400 RepID=UPI00360C5334
MRFDQLLSADDLTLKASSPAPARRLSHINSTGTYRQWADQARQRAFDLIGVPARTADPSGEIIRTISTGDVATAVIRLTIDDNLSLPGYLSWPNEQEAPSHRVVLALHGHGQVEACLNIDGVTEDYHHQFSHRLAERGQTVFTPELRGFGALYDLAAHEPQARLRYWHWGQPMAYTLQTDAFIHGRTLMGDTIHDLLAWEDWLGHHFEIDAIDVAGISWGGDLACSYPLYSRRVRSIFASGTLGSFTHTFRVSGNAPAHCIPGILPWLDRSDIAGLNAPTPIAIHYGENDTPRPGNDSASYNETAIDAFAELQSIYAAAGGPEPELIISAGLAHEMDIDALAAWIRHQQTPPH